MPKAAKCLWYGYLIVIINRQGLRKVWRLKTILHFKKRNKTRKRKKKEVNDRVGVTPALEAKKDRSKTNSSDHRPL